MAGKALSVCAVVLAAVCCIFLPGAHSAVVVVGPTVAQQFAMYTYGATLTGDGFENTTATANAVLRYIPQLGIAQLNLETSNFPANATILGIHVHFPTVNEPITNVMLIFCDTQPLPLPSNTVCQSTANGQNTYFGVPLAPSTWPNILTGAGNLDVPPNVFYLNIHTNIEFPGANASNPNLQGYIRGALTTIGAGYYDSNSAGQATGGLVTALAAVVLSLAALIM